MLKPLYKGIVLLTAVFLLNPAQAEVRPLPANQAFVFSAYLEKPGRLVAEWHVAPGYYIYRDKLHFSADPANALRATKIEWPASQTQRDPVGGTFRAYSGQVQIVLPLAGKVYKEINLMIQYQGCSQEGFCYAPMKKRLHVAYPFSAEGLNQAALLTVSEAFPPEMDKSAEETASFEPSLLTDQGAAKAFLSSHAAVVTLLCFLGLGVLLAFTPCSLPMLPILSSIIVGRKHRTHWKALQYSLAYVLGLSLTYAAAGLLVAWLGSSIQAYFQSPWIISGFSLLFVLLAFSMLDFFELQLPAAWREHILRWQQRQKGGSYLGDFLMGCLSTLIVSPCVTAPLVGVLAYISESGNLLLGAGALFALGLGMGLPLLLLGFSAGKYLPKSGPWMEVLQKLFAFLLFGMAIWMLSRILPGSLTLFLWASLLILTAVFLFFVEGLAGFKQYLAYFCGGLFVLYALVLFVGVSMSYSSPFYPFERAALEKSPLTANRSGSQALDFIDLKDMTQLDALLARAKRAGKPVMMDFYAAWCESCQALEATVLSQKEVQNTLRHFILLRANVTENNAFDQALLKRYHVIAPPTFLFFNPKGQEVMEKRIVGEVDHHLFLARANSIGER